MGSIVAARTLPHVPYATRVPRPEMLRSRRQSRACSNSSILGKEPHPEKPRPRVPSQRPTSFTVLRTCSRPVTAPRAARPATAARAAPVLADYVARQQRPNRQHDGCHSDCTESWQQCDGPFLIWSQALQPSSRFERLSPPDWSLPLTYVVATLQSRRAPRRITGRSR